MGPLMIDMAFMPLHMWEMWDVTPVTHTRTHGQWKVEQYSVWAESAITTTWFMPNPYSPTSGRCLLLSKRASFPDSGLPFSSSACTKQGDNLSLSLSLFPLKFCHQFPKSDWKKWSLLSFWCLQCSPLPPDLRIFDTYNNCNQDMITKITSSRKMQRKTVFHIIPCNPK